MLGKTRQNAVACCLMLAMGLLLTSLIALDAHAVSADQERICRVMAKSIIKAEERARQNPRIDARAVAKAEARYDQRCRALGDPRVLAASREPSRCEQMQRVWQADEDRREAAGRALPRGNVSVALLDFRRECPDVAKQVVEERRRAKSPQPVAVASPPAYKRPITEGTFGDWLANYDKACAGDDAQRNRCAESMIARALDEGRLAQAEVDACKPPAEQTRSQNSRFDELQRRRAAMAEAQLGKRERGAWDFWNSDVGCRLKDKVAASFTDRGIRPSWMKNQPTPPGDRDCGLNIVDPPRCDFADALVKPNYQRWESRIYRECADADPRTQTGKPSCAQQIIERALAENRITAQAYERCRRAEVAGGASVYQCLTGLAIREQATQSRIVSRSSPPRPPNIDTRGYQQSALLSAIARADWVNAPVVEPDYALTLFARLHNACPNLGYAELLPRLAQREINASRDAAGRVLSGQGTAQDTWRILSDAGKTFGGLENCERMPAFSWEREQCERERAQRRDTPPSPDGEHDAKRWLAKNACTSPATTHFGKRLAEWLFLDDSARGGMNWAAGHPRRAEFMALFDTCRLQAGEGAADAWCACYARQYRLVNPDNTIYRHPDLLAAARQSAFIGDASGWYTPTNIDTCNPYAERLEQWRKLQRPRPRVTACLVAQKPAPERLTPGVLACRYRTAWGEIEFHDSACRDRLYAHQWGGETVTCKAE
jgi:hypothetical protein